MNGIYCYKDKETGKIVYVGKDSYIEKNNRRNAHNAPCNYDNQPINRAELVNWFTKEYPNTILLLNLNIVKNLSTNKKTNKINYAKIYTAGKTYNEKQRYGIYMNGKFIKTSIYRYKLLDWFIKEYSNKVLILKL